MVPWGYVAGLQIDPIEKKPFYHMLPGEDALTFGMLGCDFHCDYCQNWITSQVLQDEAANVSERYIRETTPEKLIEQGERASASLIASSYNEPLISSEWAYAIFRLAKQVDMKCVYVSNGHATPEVLNYLLPVLDGFKIDLKSMRDEAYRQLGGSLQAVLATIKRAYELGLWVEVVTLVVPDFNDSIEELMSAARAIAAVSTEIPWHVTAFHRDYHMQDRDNTDYERLLRAAEIGEEAGLHYVYAGNLPGLMGDYEHTHCPVCNATLIERQGFLVQGYKLQKGGVCPACGAKIAGVWPPDPSTVRISQTRNPFHRRPRLL